jgi:hypothetical protein
MKKVLGTNAVTFTFDDGLASVTLDVMEVSIENRNHAMLHGFAARIGDNAAIAKSAENDWKVTEEMRRNEILALVAHYASGTTEWNVRASAKAPKQSATMLAIAAKRGCTYAEAEEWFAAKMLAELSE